MQSEYKHPLLIWDKCVDFIDHDNILIIDIMPKYRDVKQIYDKLTNMFNPDDFIMAYTFINFIVFNESAVDFMSGYVDKKETIFAKSNQLDDYLYNVIKTSSRLILVKFKTEELCLLGKVILSEQLKQQSNNTIKK